jgi:alkaline phosphatase D
MSRVLFLSLLIVSALRPSFQAHAQIQLPDNLFPDDTHAPFLWGVASGDPLPDAVLIWTRPDPEVTGSEPHTLTWEMSEDNAFLQVVASGTITVDQSTDHCARVDVTGLLPSQFYYYRFTAEDGSHSAIGRTRTAPSGAVEQLKLAVASCSSIYSGYFNAYARIAERNDLDLVIHLGDYLYDFVDPDEQVRVPDPFPTGPSSEDEWRDRHLFYLLDPDLRAARQMHPWAVIWDNHDYKRTPESGFDAFWEYVPRRDVHGDIGKIHRTLRYGDLLDLTLIDIQKFRNSDTIAPGEASVLSNDQRVWLLNELGSSQSRWRVVGDQKMFSGWVSEGIPAFIPVPNDGGVFDRGSWDGFMAERDTILRFVEENNIDNLMVISGDVHMSFAMDISREPRNGDVYDPSTGNGSLGVEFIPTSISRGNFDEAGVPAGIVPLFESISNGINPHHRYTEFVQHGYGILNIDPDSIVAEWWYSPILEISPNEVMAKSMTVGNGQNRWKRPNGFEPNGTTDAAGGKFTFDIYPNPNSGLMHVRLTNGRTEACIVRILDVRGKEVMHTDQSESVEFSLNTSALEAGTYIIELQMSSGTSHKMFLKQ